MEKKHTLMGEGSYGPYGLITLHGWNCETLTKIGTRVGKVGVGEIHQSTMEKSDLRKGRVLI